MSTDALALLLLILTCAAIVVHRTSRASVFNGVIFGTIVFCSFALLLFLFMADHFSGEGINEAVIFHLRYGMGGAGFSEYRAEIAGSIIALVCGALLAFAGPTFRRKHGNKSRIPGYVAYVVVFCAIAMNPAVPGLYALTDLGEKVEPQPAQAESDFGRYYRKPTIEQIADETKNVVFIYAEGLERTYFDEELFPGLIKGLRQLETEATYFTDIRQVTATGFTIGGMVASQCGIPLFTSAGHNTMGGMDEFLPGAPGLGNLLKEEGYYLSYLGGAMMSFAGKGKFYLTHKFDEVRGLEILINQVDDPEYLSPWGLHDDTLFDLAYKRFVELSESEKKFGLFMITLDTHHPNGYVSNAGKDIIYGDGSNPMLNAVAASDFLITDFVNRIRNSPYSDDTVIVVASDHLAMANAAMPIIQKGSRRDMFMILDPDNPEPRKVDRLGSTMDIGTTLLPALGFRGEIGLGRDLLAPDYSRQEIEFIDSSNNLHRWKPEISKFWEFPSIEQSMSVCVSGQRVMLDNRTFEIPVLIELDGELHTTLNFPKWPNGEDRALPERVRQMAEETPYLLIDRWDHLGDLVRGQKVADWCIVSGRGQSPRTVVPLNEDHTYSLQEVLILTGLNQL